MDDCDKKINAQKTPFSWREIPTRHGANAPLPMVRSRHCDPVQVGDREQGPEGKGDDVHGTRNTLAPDHLATGGRTQQALTLALSPRERGRARQMSVSID